MDEDFERLLSIFRVEAAEVLDELSLSVESMSVLLGKELSDSITAGMRLAHNVKGAAAVVGNEEIVRLAHALEDALSRMRGLDHSPSQGALDVLQRGITMMQRLVDDDGTVAEAQSVVESLLAMVEPGGSNPAAGTPVPEQGTGSPQSQASQEERPRSTSRTPVTKVDPGSTVRVETGRLDRLMGYIGELFVTHGRLAVRTQKLDRCLHDLRDLQTGRSPDNQRGWGALARELEELVEEDRHELLSFGHLTSELGAAMRGLTMVPMSFVAQAWRRAVRQSAQSLNKRVSLVVELGEIELDRLVLEKLREPMLHLLRNAVAHGLESDAVRRAQGKSVRGTVRVRAHMLGSRVCIDVSDDGRGIDPQAIGDVAVRSGLCSEGERQGASEAALLGYLFAPGFSSAESVDAVSGRGLGLDVVQRSVSALGGAVEVVPRGQLGGATFIMTLPVSLLSSRGLLVRAGGTCYALPIEHVEHTLRIERGGVESLDGAPAVRLHGSGPVALRWLGDLMGVGRDDRSPMLRVVVVRAAGIRLGLVVDEVLREEEYVVKKLPWNLKRVFTVSGAVVLPDGSLAVAVDPVRLVDLAVTSVEGGAQVATTVSKRKPLILVADDSLVSRTLQYNSLAAAGYDVVLAVDGEEAWRALHEHEIDLLVSDVRMPGIDGLELTRRVRADARLAHLPVILVTGLADPEAVSSGAAAGADEYVVKGDLDQEKLLEAVVRLL